MAKLRIISDSKGDSATIDIMDAITTNICLDCGLPPFEKDDSLVPDGLCLDCRLVDDERDAGN